MNLDFRIFLITLILQLRVSKTASGESGQNDAGLCVARAYELLQKPGQERAQQGKRFQPVVLSDLRAKATCGKGAFLLP